MRWREQGRDGKEEDEEEGMRFLTNFGYPVSSLTQEEMTRGGGNEEGE